MDRLRDYSNALDFLVIPDPDEPGEQNSTADKAVGEPDTQKSSTLGGDALLLPVEEVDPWAEVLHIETRSDVMQEAWRRLRLSAPFRPHQYLSWVQGANEPFPVLRIHNQEIVRVDDPYAEQRVELALADEEDNAVAFSDQGTLPDDPEAESELPDPTLYYELDGTAKLIRTRFLHLELDLEIREPIYETMAPAESPVPTVYGPESGVSELSQPSTFEVHKLQQSRQVKTDRMEYFDGPVIGVLAYITTFDMETQADLQDIVDE